MSITFGQYLRELRKDQGISQRDLAAHVGVDFTYLSKIESGQMSPPGKTVITRIARALNTDEEHLVHLAGKIPPELKEAVKHNVLLAELVYLLGKQELPGELYHQMITLIREQEK